MDEKKFVGVVFGLGSGCVMGADPSPGYTPVYISGGQGQSGMPVEAVSS